MKPSVGVEDVRYLNVWSPSVSNTKQDVSVLLQLSTKLPSGIAFAAKYGAMLWPLYRLNVKLSHSFPAE